MNQSITFFERDLTKLYNPFENAKCESCSRCNMKICYSHYIESQSLEKKFKNDLQCNNCKRLYCKDCINFILKNFQCLYDKKEEQIKLVNCLYCNTEFIEAKKFFDAIPEKIKKYMSFTSEARTSEARTSEAKIN
jgi:hypothetical protein